MGKYRFNKETLKFVEDKIGVKGWIKRVIKYIFISILLSLLYYFIISLVYSTESERRISRENKLLEQEYENMRDKLEVLDNTISNLQIRDREIYKKLFNAEPTSLSLVSQEYLFTSQIDTSDNMEIVNFISDRLGVLEQKSSNIDRMMSDIAFSFEKFGKDVSAIPSIIPVKKFNINQVGASVGKKINPFFKTIVTHNGIDLLSNTGTEVIAPADGTVVSASRAAKGTGNSMVIDHGNGYVTKYMYLGDILVRQGQKVKQGNTIARIGVTGMSFGPHLHYEVLKDGVNQDPIYYFFADISPELFKGLIIITANTGQSLD